MVGPVAAVSKAKATLCKRDVPLCSHRQRLCLEYDPVVRGERGSSAPMMNKYRLMSPGPTPIPPEVSAAGALPIIHHRPPGFCGGFPRGNENLQRGVFTENDIFTY